MSYANALFFYGYVAALVLVGGAGIFFAEWELTRVFALDLDALPERARATLLNQYRFLKSAELGFGLFCLVFRRQIFTDRRFLGLFLTVLSLGVGARTLSVLLDGGPQPIYIGFLLFELATGLVVFLHARPTLAPAAS